MEVMEILNLFSVLKINCFSTINYYEDPFAYDVMVYLVETQLLPDAAENFSSDLQKSSLKIVSPIQFTLLGLSAVSITLSSDHGVRAARNTKVVQFNSFI